MSGLQSCRAGSLGHATHAVSQLCTGGLGSVQSGLEFRSWEKVWFMTSEHAADQLGAALCAGFAHATDAA